MSSKAISSDERNAALDLLGRYFWAVDTGDIAAIVEAFSSDAVIEYAGGERFEKQEGVLQFARKVVGGARAKGRVHLNHPLFFSRSAEGHVQLRSYILGAHWSASTDVRTLGVVSYTDDSFAETSDGLRITRRFIFRWNDATALWKADRD